MTDYIMDFERGPYNEIFPYPLIAGVDPEEAVDRLIQFSAGMGIEVDKPEKGRSREGMYNLGLLFIHQTNLAEVIGGNLNIPDAEALHEAVVLNKERLSLRPLGLEHLYFKTFAPVFQRLTETIWRVGLPETGHYEDFEAATPYEAIKQAQQRYQEWSQAEEDKWEQWVQEALPQISAHINHIVWEAAITNSSHRAEVTIFEGYILERLGKHTTYQIHTPDGVRIFNASSRGRAVKMADALVRSRIKGVVYPDPTAFTSLQALAALSAIKLQKTETGWRAGRVEARLSKNQRDMQLKCADRYYLLGRKDEQVILQIIKNGRPDRVIASIILPASWEAADYKEAAITWAAWIIEKRSKKE